MYSRFFSFAAATVLVSSQYAQYGMSELPNRLSHCVDDLQLYKRDTDTVRVVDSIQGQVVKYYRGYANCLLTTIRP